MKRSILGTYQNGNYSVVMMSDGTKIRHTKEGVFLPIFPENCDVKITDKCDGRCTYCYEGCTEKGKHAELFNVDGTPRQAWLVDVKPYTELALNGNDLTHPDLSPDSPRLLEYLREKKVIANITVNQKHFTKHYETLRKWSESKLVFGIGVSLVDATDSDFVAKVKSLPNAVVHTIAGILTEKDINLLKDNDLKVLVLGYKQLNRGKTYFDNYEYQIVYNMEMLKTKLQEMPGWFKVISFDNLALEQLNVREVLFANKEDEWERFYMGDDGSATMYVDAVKEQFSKNSCMSDKERFSSKGMTLVDMFTEIGTKYSMLRYGKN